jgi:hypothetical protein
MKSRLLYLIISLLTFFGLFSYLVNQSNNTYNPHLPGDYHSSLFADAAGYHVYLPGVFNSWFFGKVPEKADSIAGNGFVITSDKKIKTKYPYGTALLQAPIYLIGKIHSSITNESYEGNSVLNQKYADFAGIFYGLAAIFMLFFYLKKRTDILTASITSIVILFGTNLYYYTIKASSYSHIYSFFLFVSTLQLSRFYFNKPSTFKFVLLSCCVLVIYLVRPFNILFVPLIVFVDSISFSDVKSKFLQLLSVKNILFFVILAAIFISPQLIYWKWAFGSYLPDTYPGESFSNLLKPQIIPFLFAPHNGLIPYSPVFIVLLLFLFIYPFCKKWEGFSILIFIVLMTFLSTAWYTYAMGCGFGARNFVEYSAVLSIPFALVLHEKLKHWAFKILLFCILIYPISINITLTNNFDMCFFGKGDWDWKEYNYLFYQKQIKIKVDPDSSLQFINEPKVIKDFTRQNNSCFSADQAEFVCTLSIPFNEINKVPTVMCTLSADINNLEQPADFEFVVQILRNGKQIYYNGNPIKNETKGWYSIYHVAYFPKELLLSDELRVFLLNKNKSNFLVDNIEVITR